ncbi:MAG: TolC family protein [Gemmatimonadaceae bacterium]
MTGIRTLCAAVLSVVAVGVSSAADAQQTGDTLSLAQAVDMAQRQGFSARIASSSRDAGRWRDQAFASRLLPQLSLTSDLPIYNRSIIQVLQPDGSTKFVPQQQRTAALGLNVAQKLPFTGGDLFVSSQLTNVNIVGTQDSKLWRSTPVQVGIRQSLLRPNTARWDSREQNIRIEVSDRQYLEAREDIALTTSNLYFDVFAARATLINAEANSLVNDTLYTLNKGRYEVGKIGENDLLQSELALLRSRNSLDQARLDFDRASAALRIQLGLPTGTPLNVSVPAAIPSLVADTTIAVQQALKNRSQERDLELQDVQSKRRVTEARLNNGVGATVSAAVGYNQSAQTFNSAFQSPLQSQQFQVSVEMPIVQWGGRHEQIEAAKADRNRVVTQAQAARAQTAQEAHFAALQLSQAERQLALSAKADTVGTKRFEVAKNRYVIGRIGIDNLYLAQTEKDQGLLQYVQALRGYWDAFYRLRRLTLYDFERNAPIR